MNKQVLIVEDDLALGQVMQKALIKRQYRVQFATNLESAQLSIQQCLSSQDALHLAILDLKLEDATTLELIPQLRNAFSDIQIVVLTGYASIATAVQAVKLGADNYLPKPATITDILQALGEVEGDVEVEVDEAESLVPLSTKRMEWEHIQRILQKNEGNISATARELNMHRRTLQRKLQKSPVKN